MVAAHIHFFWRNNTDGKLEFGFCKHCGAGPACEKCRGTGRGVVEMGCFGPKRWERCRGCKGRGLVVPIAARIRAIAEEKTT